MSAYTDREAGAVARFETLSTEFVDALMAGPTSSLHVPGRSEPPSIADYLAAEFDDQGICDLLRIVADLARAGNRRAQAWIKREADLYAAVHCRRAG